MLAVRQGGAAPRRPPLRFPRCAAADTVAGACEGLVDDLLERWPLPSVYLLLDGRMRCQAARGYFQVVDGFPPGTGVIGRVVMTGKPVLLQDAAADPGFIAAVPGVVAEGCAPLIIDGDVVGAVSVEARQPLEDDAADVIAAAAAVLSEQIAALGGVPAVTLAQRVARIAVGLSALPDAEQIERRAVEGAIQLSGMATAALSRPDARGTWSTSHASGPLAPALLAWTDAEHRVVAAWVKAGTSSHFPGGEDVPAEYDFLQRAGVRAISVQPLVVAGQVTGLLTTADTQPVPHDPGIGAALELLATQAAASLGMASALEELSRRATQDSLTGLRNSAAFTSDLQDAVTRPSASPATATACLLVDVDHFKHVNDTYGHLAGDRLLVGLAEELVRELRDGDELYRIGGDEFAVLLSDTTAVAADAVAQRLVEAARRVRTTVSVGSALVRTTAEDVRLRADRALYLAKAAGRDRAHTAADPA